MTVYKSVPQHLSDNYKLHILSEMVNALEKLVSNDTYLSRQYPSLLEVVKDMAEIISRPTQSAERINGIWEEKEEMTEVNWGYCEQCGTKLETLVKFAGKYNTRTGGRLFVRVRWCPKNKDHNIGDWDVSGAFSEGEEFTFGGTAD